MRIWTLALSNSLLDDYPLTLPDREFVQQPLHNCFGITSLPSIEQIERELGGIDTFTEDDTQ
ncbi:hypothetical protein NTGHW29_70033 [Candidatus Nitrotoga sp. HW29]|uniref:hypothetical protein n=1 Tax=Candidatus Nitrotoga sp. HW29 TaxID=2886963 RepID=UPI001EF284EF|nr:hypothetical protein [Candidatus Nitrotoga sp. HW29]CAH1905893.1 hypothetical protein NTGHW29_70033 [Candidatus Nitrotoga sp. HW29]